MSDARSRQVVVVVMVVMVVVMVVMVVVMVVVVVGENQLSCVGVVAGCPSRRTVTAQFQHRKGETCRGKSSERMTAVKDAH
ncbi:hypothetical protein E2C01_038806 [Portunus trituberculatus]|uniref:Uncharacterized protein n=1 Tax=Portunus trituberculatus TaxID=210409 RepID=A0A5B7FD51_PORTR|nr:hypothetical protein [Portunus trituberculatus]